MAEQDIPIRVATWNLWWRFGPWERRQALIADELVDVDADVVCLQEVWADVGDRTLPTPPTVAVDDLATLGARPAQPVMLADALEFSHGRYAWRYAHEGRAFGNAILSRWPVLAADALALPALERYEEHRTALRVVLDTPAGRLAVVTTHLNFRWDQSHVRQAQVDGIMRWLAADAERGLPVVLTGDLNADPLSDEVRTLTGRRPVPVEGAGFFDAWEAAGTGDGATWTQTNGHAAATSAEPDRRIDYVLVGYPRNRALQVTAARRIGTRPTGGCHPSDHLGVCADLRPVELHR